MIRANKISEPGYNTKYAGYLTGQEKADQWSFARRARKRFIA